MLKEEYKNITAFHPGYYLTDVIEELQMTQEEFARRTGMTGKTVSLLLNGQTPLSNDMAMRISAMLGLRVETLLNLQKKFDEKIIEIETVKAIDAQIEILDCIDYPYFVKNGFLPECRNKMEKIVNLCSFLKVSNLRFLLRRDLFASFRTTVPAVTQKNIINANVWMQTALNKGFATETKQYDEKKLKAYLKELRLLTKQEPEVFLPRLQEIFDDCGVAFVVLPALKNCGVNGVVKWYDDKVVLAMNDRFKYSDTFWFSLFHEIKHVFQKKKTKLIVNYDGDYSELDNRYEEEADAFASELLIPAESYCHFLEENPIYISKTAVEGFASDIEVHPGIVVGRLQFDRKIPHSAMTQLRQQLHM